MARNSSELANGTTEETFPMAILVLEDIVFPTIYCLIVLGGFIGNSMVIAVVKKKRSMQSTTNLLLANLCIADLWTLLWSTPNEILLQLNTMHPTGKTGSYICKIFTLGNLTVISLIVSIMIMTLLALERYNALVKPFKSRIRLRRNKVVFVVVSFWVIALLLSLPVFIMTDYKPSNKWCDTTWKMDKIKAYIIFLLITLFCLPLAIISFCYFSVINELNRLQKRNGVKTGNHLDFHSTRKVINMLLLVTCGFAVLFGVFAVARFLYELDLINSIIYNASVLLLYSSCAANPVIYASQSSNYRNAFKEFTTDFFSKPIRDFKPAKTQDTRL